jgi:uncharacterized protein YycO
MERINVTLPFCPSLEKYSATTRVELSGDDARKAVLWCEEHIGKRYETWDIFADYAPKFNNNWLFSFLNDESATWFRLVWG